MKIRNMALRTQYIYLRAVAKFSLYHGRLPDKLGPEGQQSAGDGAS